MLFSVMAAKIWPIKKCLMIEKLHLIVFNYLHPTSYFFKVHMACHITWVIMIGYDYNSREKYAKSCRNHSVSKNPQTNMAPVAKHKNFNALHGECRILLQQCKQLIKRKKRQYQQAKPSSGNL